LAQQPTDRTPRDFWAEVPTMNRLFEHLGHRDEERLLRSLGIDIRHLNAVEPSPRALPGGVHQNMWGERFVLQATDWGPMREDTAGALSAARSLDELESFAWPSPDQMDYSHLTDQCRQHEEYALMYGFADIWQRGALVRGLENMFIDMVEHPEWAHFLSRKLTDFYLEDYTRAAEATHDRIDLFLVLSDLGGQNGPLISRDMFQQFVAPYIKEICDRIHSLGAKSLFHSCGSIRPFIADLIDLGVDVLDPIQPTGPEMAPESLQSEFGGRLCFHGGIDMQALLPFGSPDEIRAEVRRYCDTLGDGGGYILAPAHLFQPDIPPENILAVYDA
jgi:uroporphyrinogen decarboxylase